MGTCQSLTNTCKSIPTNPRTRQKHTSIIYKTYSKSQADSMCVGLKCGPLCDKIHSSCFTNNVGQDGNYTEGLIGFKGPIDDNCPNRCCSEGNEFCFRKYDNTGNEVDIDQEIMLIFGGITQNEVVINDKNIAHDCDIDFSCIIFY